MAALVIKIFELHFCAMGGSGDTLSIFIYDNGPSSHSPIVLKLVPTESTQTFVLFVRPENMCKPATPARQILDPGIRVGAYLTHKSHPNIVSD